MTTVGDLRRWLDCLSDDMEVRFASQPSWPFEYAIKDFHISEGQEPEYEEVFYLVEGRQLGYLPSEVSKNLGWKNGE